jgi:hypothetical protein
MKSSIGDNSRPCAIVVCDFNNDNKLNVVVGNSGTDNIGIFIGNDHGTFPTPIIYPTNYESQSTSISIADFNNHHKLDVVVANYGTHNIGIFFAFNNRSFDQQKLFVTDALSYPQYVTVGDLSKDNFTDIVIVDLVNGYMRKHLRVGVGECVSVWVDLGVSVQFTHSHILTLILTEH